MEPPKWRLGSDDIPLQMFFFFKIPAVRFFFKRHVQKLNDAFLNEMELVVFGVFDLPFFQSGFTRATLNHEKCENLQDKCTTSRAVCTYIYIDSCGARMASFQSKPGSSKGSRYIKSI